MSDTLALHGGAPVRGPEKKWPSWPVFDDTERRALNEVLESGNWFFGERVKRFEEQFAAFQDAKHGISCNSGTTALEIALQAAGVGHGHEVIVPPFTFVATASAVLRVGARPVFVDLDESWCLDPGRIEEALTPRTWAIVPVHFGGRVCDMDRFNEIAVRHHLPIIEDACHSWGAKYKGHGTGGLGVCGVFSFQMSKNITAGEGGIILSNDDVMAEKCRSLSNCGRENGMPWYHHINPGTNVRLTEFQAAILSAQLTRLEEQTLLRERNGALLYAELGDIEGLTLQPSSNRITRRAFHLLCLRIEPEAFGCTREKFVAAANAEGLPVSGGYPLPLYEQPLFRNMTDYDYSKCHCPVAEDLCRVSGMWLAHQYLLGSEEDMRDIVRIVRKIKDQARML